MKLDGNNSKIFPFNFPSVIFFVVVVEEKNIYTDKNEFILD